MVDFPLMFGACVYNVCHATELLFSLRILRRMEDFCKGNSVQLSTFAKWTLGNDIGFTTEIISGRNMVTRVWCKLCAKYLEKIITDRRIRGRAIHEVQVYARGTPSVTKHNVGRHLSSKVS